MNSSYSSLPRGFSLSRKFIFTVMAVLVLLVGTFIVCLHHYMPSRAQEMSGPTLIDTSTVNEAMDEINNEAAQKNDAGISQHRQYNDAQLSGPHDVQVEQAFQQNQDVYQEPAYSTPRRQVKSAYKAVAHSQNYGQAQMDVTHSTSTVTHNSSAAALSDAQESLSDAAKRLNEAVEREEAVIHATLLAPMTPFEVKAGNIIPAILQTPIISDLPGTLVAKVRRDVFDSVSGKHLLIPQGTTLIGAYDSQIATGQARILMAWSRLIFPNGDSINLKGQPGTDAMGASGLRDKVDNHYTKLFGTSFMYSLVTAGTRLTNGNVKVEDMTPQQAATESIAQQIGQTSAALLEKNLSIQPTITIREGTLFNVLLTKDLVLPHAYQESKGDA